MRLEIISLFIFGNSWCFAFHLKPANEVPNSIIFPTTNCECNLLFIYNRGSPAVTNQWWGGGDDYTPSLDIIRNLVGKLFIVKSTVNFKTKNRR